MKLLRFISLLVMATSIGLTIYQGISLTVYLLGICAAILFAATWIEGRGDEGYHPFLMVLLTLAASFSLFTLNELYHPDPKVISNADTHILIHKGFHSNAERITLTGGSQALFKNRERLGNNTLSHDELGYLLQTSVAMPVFVRTSLWKNDHPTVQVDSLINPLLPATQGFVGVTFRSTGVTLSVTITEQPGQETRYVCNFSNGGEPQTLIGSYITKSLPLDVALRGLRNDSDGIDWQVLSGISLVREIAGAPATDQPLAAFRIGVTAPALHNLLDLTTNDRTYSADVLRYTQELPLPEGHVLRIGTGLDASPAFQLERREQATAIWLEKPTRRALVSNVDNAQQMTLFVTTSDSSLVHTAAREGITFPQATPFSLELRYHADSLGTSLKAKLIPMAGVNLFDSRQQSKDWLIAGDTLYVSRSNQANPISNILLFQDLHSNSPFKAMDGFRMIYLLLAVALISWAAGRRKPFQAEAIAWLIVLAFITVRSFLAWRLLINPPLNLSEFAFREYCSDRYVLDGTAYFIVALGAFTVLFKLCGNTLYTHLRPVCQRMPAWLLPLLTLAWLSIGYLSKSLLSDRIAYVLIPLLVMVMVEVIANMRSNASDKGFLVCQILSHLFAIAFAIKFDKGAGIVFLMAGLFILSLRLIRKDGLNQLLGLILFSMLLLGFFGANQVVVCLYNHTNTVIGVMAVLLLSLSSLFIWKCRLPLLGKVVALCGAVVIVGLIYYYLPPILEDNRHIYYRAQVHVSEPDQILIENELNTSDMRRLMQNLENRWFLSYYNDLPQATDQPYTLRSHFDQGVTYQTQKTDIIVSRFIISEHGAVVIYLLIFTLILAIGLQTGSRSTHNAEPIIFLFVQSLLILMAVTSRYIFLGQDFMLLSAGSYLTLATTGLLFAVYIAGSSTPTEPHSLAQKGSRYRLAYVLLPLGLFAGVLLTDPSLKESQRIFSVRDTLLKAEAELTLVNQRLAEYQIANGYHFKQAPDNIESFMQQFETQTQTRELLAKQASPFTCSLYEQFLHGGARKNSSELILHGKLSGSLLELAVNRSYYSITPPEDKQIGWRGDILAIGEEQQDKLVLTEGRNTRELPLQDGERLFTDTQSSYDYPIYLGTVPKDWTLDGTMRLIAAPKQVPIEISCEDPTQITLNPQQLRYVALLPDDKLTIPKDELRAMNRQGTIRFQPAIQDSYMARFMNVNGSSRWVYPTSSTLLPFHLTQLYRTAMSDKGTTENIQLSLVSKLQENIYSLLSQYTSESYEPVCRSVIIANNKGNVLSLVSAKNPYTNQVVNPNNPDEVSKMRNYFYMSGKFLDEEKCLSDLNFRFIYPGSTMKPIVTAAMLSQLPELVDFKLFVNPQQQGLTFENGGQRIVAHSYVGKHLRLPSLYNDEVGINGVTDMKRYLTKSSNFYNSLLIFMGYYKTPYLKEQLNLLSQGKPTELFRPVTAGESVFPQFIYQGRRYTFDHWLTDDPLQTHEHSALQVGLLPLGLSDAYPGNASLSQLRNKEYMISMPINLGQWAEAFPFAFPRSSYLPETARTTRQGMVDGLRGTTLGSYPYFVTPWQMCLMYNRFFAQNVSLQLSLDVDCQTPVEPLPIANESAYEQALSEQILPGLQAVPLVGTAQSLRPLAQRLAKQGITLYAKTGTISNGGEGSSIPESKLLAVVVKRSYQSGSVLDWMKTSPHLVFYFVSEEGAHNYVLIEKIIETALHNPNCSLKEEE